MTIKLNDFLNLPLEGDIKVKFNMPNSEGGNPLDDYLDNPDSANRNWMEWKNTYADFRIGTIGICLMRLQSGLYLLTCVCKVIEDKGKNNDFSYVIEYLEEYKKYFGRVILKYNGTLSKQYIRYLSGVAEDLEIYEILPEQYSGRVFPGIENVRISLKELKVLDDFKRLDWIHVLSNQKGIYLITDLKTKNKYVGSAYGNDGLWQRWLGYIYSKGHGGNVELQKLLEHEGPEYALENFEFAVLETFGTSTTTEHIINRETWWKATLRTELNKN